MPKKPDPEEEEEEPKDCPDDPRPKDPTPKEPTTSEKKDPRDLNEDGKVDEWDWWTWFWGRRLWELLNPPGMPKPPGFGDKGPGTNDPRFFPDSTLYGGEVA